MFWCYCWPQNGILDKSAQIGWTWHSKTYLFFGIDHHDVLVQRWALDVIWSITMAHFVGQTKASSGFAVLLERLLSLHDRSRGQGQGMMSKSDPSVTCYWYDKTRDTLVSLLEVHSPNWSLELQWKCLCPCNLHLIDPKGSGDGRADAKSHAKWTFTRSLSSFCSVSYISYLRSNYNTTASFGGALMQEEKTWPHSSLSLYNIAQSGLNLLGILLCSVQRRGQKGPWRLELQNLCGLLPLSTGGLITDWQLPLSKALFYWEVRSQKKKKQGESIVDTELVKEWHDLYCDRTNVQKNVIDFCLPFFYARGNMSQVSHISFISNPEHLEAGGEEPKKVPLRIRIIAVTML